MYFWVRKFKIQHFLARIFKKWSMFWAQNLKIYIFLVRKFKKTSSMKKTSPKKENIKTQGAHGFEPWTSRSAVECSTTELRAQTVIVLKQSHP